MITLYDSPMAPSPRRARILLAEKGVTHQTVLVDLRRGEQMGTAYRQINPLCTVPALRIEEGEAGEAGEEGAEGREGKEGGQMLIDNAAIAAYLEARFPEPPLLGITPLEKAEVASWNWRVEFEGLMAIAEALRNSSPAMQDRALPGPIDYAQIPELAQRGLQRLAQFFETMNTRLEGRDTLATDRFSIADITAMVTVDFAKAVRLQPGDAHPHLQRWRAAMALRPSMAL